MKNIQALFLLFAVFFISAVSISAQETEAAASSNLTGISLPAGAQRVLPNAVPAEITDALDKIVAEGGGKFRKGESEVLIWAGGNYSKAAAQTTVNRLTDSLKVAGWNYSNEGEESGLTVFGVTKTGANPRAIVGFHGATDDALIFTWMEILPNTVGENISQTIEEPAQKTNNKSNGSIVGSWDNGRVSMVTRQNTITGATSPGSSSRFEYNFTADGGFSFTGLMQTVNYSCTDTLYNEKNGRYVLEGSTLTMIPAKNFWRKTNSCSASGNSEKNYTLEKEVYQFSTRTDEYGKELICLANDKGESCYRRK